MNDVDDAFAGILADDWLLAPATDFPAIQLLLDFLGRFTHSPAEHSVMGSACVHGGSRDRGGSFTAVAGDGSRVVVRKRGVLRHRGGVAAVCDLIG